MRRKGPAAHSVSFLLQVKAPAISSLVLIAKGRDQCIPHGLGSLPGMASFILTKFSPILLLCGTKWLQSEILNCQTAKLLFRQHFKEEHLPTE